MKKFSFKKEELELLITSHEKYFAHLSKDEKQKEPLIEHLLLTQKYFLKLIEVNKLENIIWNLIRGITDNKTLQTIIAELFVKSVVLHDLGKVNPKFQKNKMKNDNIQELEHNLCSNHSLIGAYIFILYGEILAQNKEVSKEDESFIDFIILSFSYLIMKHHSSSIDKIYEIETYSIDLEELKKFIPLFSWLNDSGFIQEINKYVICNFKKIVENSKNKIEDPFALYTLLKLLYSLLTASDYYATTHFIDKWKNIYDDFGILDKQLKNKIKYKIKKTKSYNENTYKILEQKKVELNFPNEQNNRNLNILRQNLAIEVITNLRKNFDKNLFYIEAPTGSGKTNLSMLSIAELLANDTEDKITKIFYVFPFTTLIEQTFDSLIETLSLNKEEIIQIHSKAGFSQKKDDKYGKEKENFIDYQFVNYPIVLISHVKFFDILKSKNKNINYLLHRIANSIVIIDEIQAYSPTEWDKIAYFIYKYSYYFNIKFILMSATLPKIDKLLSPIAKNDELKNIIFINLVNNKELYFTNPNFKNRVEFDLSLLEIDWNKNNKEEYFIKLWDKIIEESKKFAETNANKVYCIVEFIFNKTATEFIYFIEKNCDIKFFNEIYVLSGTILEPRRKEIIAIIKSRLYKKLLVITTQVVEAGLDIDMDIGFKDISLLDSEEQLAGRINRNITKKGCKLFLFDLDDASILYKNDDRYQITKINLKKNYLKILKNKKFDNLYNRIIKKRNIKNQSIGTYINIKDYLKSIVKLEFSEIDYNFKIIDNKNYISCFVPIRIPIKISYHNQKNSNFTKEEIKFLEEKGYIQREDTTIEGEKIWELYCKIIKNKEQINFEKKKIELSIIQKILSKFTFSIFSYSKHSEILLTWGAANEQYGFYKINNPDLVYDYQKGIILINDSNIW